MGYALLIIGLLAVVASIVYQVLFVKKLESSKKTKIGMKSFKKLGMFAALTAGGALIANIGLVVICKWWEKTAHIDGVFQGESINFALQMAMMMVGIMVLAASINTLVLGFRFRYYKTNIDKDQRKIASKILFISIPVVVVSFLLWSNGIGVYLAYPLISGFGIDSSGFHFTATSSGIIWQPEWADGIRGANSYQSGGFKIAFYALFILLGFGVCYWISDHELYKKYGKHGEADVIAILAFLSGVLGARIWYVVGNWSREFAGQPWYTAFVIWNGGLTILGGAFFGFVVGYLLVHFLRPHWEKRFVIDFAVPTILLAQAIGRTGNFTNIEVYGNLVNINEGIWRILPNWMLMQMNFTPNAQSLGAGMIHVPLWFIEASINLAGYFIIRFAIGKGLKKFIVQGDLGAAYFIWYGLIRFILEPLRDSNYNMGTDNSWSICNSLGYIFIGLAIATLLHIHDAIEAKQDLKKIFFPVAGAVALCSLALPALQSLTISETTDVYTKYSGFEVMFKYGNIVPIIGLIPVGLSGIALLVAGFIKDEKMQRYLAIGGSALSLVGIVLFFMSNKWINIVPEGYDPTKLTFNLSYGFVLVSLVNLLVLATGIGSIWAMMFKGKSVEPAVIEEAENV
ncbi:MAG: prolipoprotein diacylglyceryl transferase [Bacilli bacterium]|nr:prolipoprotein diacylglyceryl transferase [Bacilli bacterium]